MLTQINKNVFVGTGASNLKSCSVNKKPKVSKKKSITGPRTKLFASKRRSILYVSDDDFYITPPRCLKTVTPGNDAIGILQSSSARFFAGKEEKFERKAYKSPSLRRHPTLSEV